MIYNEEEQLEIEEISLNNSRISIIESLLFTAGEPLKYKDICEILEINPKKLHKLLGSLEEIYSSNMRGIQLLRFDDSCQLATKIENNAYIRKLLKENTRLSLSQASLETLAIVAYKQPITRVTVDEIRGVKSDRAIINLVEKKLIEECGRLDVPGRPILYRTTEAFLQSFGILNLKSLPILEGFEVIEKDEEDIES